MSQQHGRRYENELANDLAELTTDDVWVACVGFSGNSKRGSCDLVATVSPELVTRHESAAFHIEAKKRQGKSGKRVTVLEGSSQGDSGLDELRGLVEDTPSWATPVLAVKFDRRKLSIIDARELLAGLTDYEYHAPEGAEFHEARFTPSDNVSMVKPTLDDWQSSRAADDDAVVLAQQLGLPTEGDDG